MVVALPEELTIPHAAELRALLLSALEGEEPVQLDGRSVAEVDAAGLQVLCAAGRSARRRGRQLGFMGGGRSAALADAVELAGLGNDGDAWLRGEAAP